MKMSKEHYQILRNGMLKVYEYLISNGASKEDILDPKNGMMYRLYFKAFDDMQYDDTHPRYTIYPRICEYIPNINKEFSIYNDSHIRTAINTIFQEITS